MHKSSNLAEPLVNAGLRCPGCRARPRAAADGIKCQCGLSRDFEAGAIDLTLPSPRTQRSLAGNAADVMAALGMPDTEDGRRAVERALGPVPRTGNLFFDMEEEILLDRFGLENYQPQVALGPAYPSSRVRIGSPFAVALRVKNVGAFPLSSTAAPPVVVSYHWLDQDGEILVFEGARSSLPIKLRADSEVTVLVDIHPLPDARAGPHILRFHVIHEGVRRLPARLDVSIDLTTDQIVPPDTRVGIPFSESEDGIAGAIFLAQNLRAKGLIIEIGGGLRPIFDEAFPEPTSATLVNIDASLRLLRLSHVLRPRPDAWMIRADAVELPFQDNSAEAIIYCRSLHHFPNLHNQMADAYRVLRPGGALFLICEPVGVAYDDFTRDLIRNGVNEQVFPLGAYERIATGAGFETGPTQLDWGMSFKGKFLKPG